MARLPEGLKQVRVKSSWSDSYTIEYEYKGVRVFKGGFDMYFLRAEYFNWRNGTFAVDTSTGAWRLMGVPRMVEEYLTSEDYYLDPERRLFLLTPEGKAKRLQSRIDSNIKDRDEQLAKLHQYLEEGNYSKVAEVALYLAKVSEHLTKLEEGMTALAA